MTIAAIIFGILCAGAIGRVIFLNAEIRTLDGASIRFGSLIENWQKPHLQGEVIPTKILEAQTEYEWLINARDSKKEVRTVWFGGAALLLILLGSALFGSTQQGK